MKKILISMMACTMLLLPGCNKIKDATSRDIKVNNIKFDFVATTTASATTSLKSESLMATKAGPMISSFSATRTVDLSEIGEPDLEKHRKKIDKVKVTRMLVVVTSNPSGAYTVTNLKIVAEGAGQLVIPTYTIGGTFTPPSEMDSFLTAFFNKLFDGPVKVTVTGLSDAPVGTTITVRCESDVIFTASLL